MSSPSTGNDLPAARKQVAIRVVESGPADAHLTEVTFKAAGLTSGVRSVSDGERCARICPETRKVRRRLHTSSDLSRSLASKVSGLEVLKAIKTTPHLMHIPIVVASGSEDSEHSELFMR
jgi:hypothetical protein